MSGYWDDPRVARGMKEQLRRRRELLDAGQKALGWKVALGAPAAKEKTGLGGPLVGFLMERALLSSGVTVSLGEWKKPMLEPEVAVYMAADLAGGADRAAARAAIGSVGPAFELADAVDPVEDLERLLAGNINQRNVILGVKDFSRAGCVMEGLTCRVVKNGEEAARTADVQANTGEVIDLVRSVADLLEAFGERLCAGQVIIGGSIVPPLWITGGEEVVFHLDPVGSVAVGFAGKAAG
jgi:2-keto-4-pentenoate hydratase